MPPAFISEIPGNEHAFKQLQELVASGEAIAFVGAGASSGRYPLWGQLIDQLMDEAVRRGLADEDDRAAWERMVGRRAQQVARLVRAKLGDRAYAEIMRETFGRQRGPDGKSYTPVHGCLLRLPFSGLVTTNYDPCLLEARFDLRPDVGATGWGTWKDQDAVHDWYTGDIFTKQSLPILFAHGIFERAETIVLTVEDYRMAYQPGAYRRLFEKLWGQERLVFVGFGFSDAWFDFLADEVITQTAAGAPRHLALIGIDPEHGGLAEDRRMFHDSYNLEPLFYPVGPNHDHSAMLEVLDALDVADAGAVAPEVVPPPASRAAPIEAWVHETTDDDTYTGRRETLDRLDRWAADPDVKAIAVTGIGGLGKTALIGRWLKREGGVTRRPYAAVFFWSFYADRSVEVFLERFLEFAAEKLDSPVKNKPGDTRAVQVALDYLRAQPICLVLDGLEVLQERPGETGYGALLAPDLRELADGLCRRQDGLLLLTSRFPFPDLTAHLGRGLLSLELGSLSPADGAALLVQLAVEGSPVERAEASRHLYGHPLALPLFAHEVVRETGGDPVRRISLVFDEAALGDDDPLESKIKRLLGFYERAIGGEQAAVLSLVALFPTPVPPALLSTLCGRLDVDDLPEGLDEAALRRMLDAMAAEGLLLREPGGAAYSCHPILRDHFRGRLLYVAAGEAASLLADQPSADEITSVDQIRPILDAIELLLDTGEFNRADELYRSRLDYGNIIQNLPAPLDGLDCAIQFVADDVRRDRCRENFSTHRLGFYLNETALFATTHPGKVEAPYTVCIASASNLTGLVKSSVECRRTGL